MTTNTNQAQLPPCATEDSPSGRLWRRWFERLGLAATVDVVNATAELVIGERDLAVAAPRRAAASPAGQAADEGSVRAIVDAVYRSVSNDDEGNTWLDIPRAVLRVKRILRGELPPNDPKAFAQYELEVAKEALASRPPVEGVAPFGFKVEPDDYCKRIGDCRLCPNPERNCTCSHHETEEQCVECGHIRAGKKSGDMCMYPFQEGGPCVHRCTFSRVEQPQREAIRRAAEKIRSHFNTIEMDQTPYLEDLVSIIESELTKG